MEKLKALWTEHKTKILIVGGILLAFVLYKKMKK